MANAQARSTSVVFDVGEEASGSGIQNALYNDKAKTAALSASRRTFMVEKIVPCRANGLARHFVTRCGSTGDACAKHLGRGEMRAS